MDVRPGLAGDRWVLDRAVFAPGQRAGHYESFYQRANHPSRPLAFWLRYTVFAPRGRPGDAVGELWAVFFDGETGEHVVARTELPMARCTFARDRFEVRVGGATLGPGRLDGTAGDLSWALAYEGAAPPLLLLEPGSYDRGFPKAKSLVPLPLARFDGRLAVAGRAVDVGGWVGSQNHNWGSEHTHRYAFGQVAGFDDDPEAFLEVATVKARVIGPVTTPWLTTLVLRHEGHEHSLVAPLVAVRARASYDYAHWDFSSSAGDVTVSGRLRAPREAFVGLRYRNPPGGSKYCLNTKIATAEVTVRERGRAPRTLHAEHRALFEILTDDDTHDVPIRA